MNESQRKGLIIAIVAVIVIVLGLAGVSYLQQRGSGAPDTVTEEQKTDDAEHPAKIPGTTKMPETAGRMRVPALTEQSRRIPWMDLPGRIRPCGPQPGSISVRDPERTVV